MDDDNDKLLLRFISRNASRLAYTVVIRMRGNLLQFHQLLKFEQICFTCFGAIVDFLVLPKLLFITVQTVPYLGLQGVGRVEES